MAITLARTVATSSTLAATALIFAFPGTASAAPAEKPTTLTSSACAADLSLGSRGPCVARVQTLLNRKAGNTLPIIGVYGQYTRRAVMAWQKDHGIAQTGIVGPLTKASLEGGTPALTAVRAPVATPSPPPTPSSTSALDRKVVQQVRVVMAGPRYPYVWGGGHAAQPGLAGGKGMDCSGFTRWVYARAAGWDVLRQSTAQDQKVRSQPTSTPHPGDLVFFTSKATGETYHVGIYLGGGSMVYEPRTGLAMQYSTVAYVAGNGATVSYGHLR